MAMHLKNVSKRVGRQIHLHPIDLVLKPGEFHVLLGRTLAGKTSLMRLMAGLDKPTTGQIEMAGTDITHLPVRKRNVAMVYQQFINYPSMSVFDNIASPLKLAKLPKDQIAARVEEAAAMLRIEHLLDRYPAELSGGQQQRTAMARALVKEADLLLMDEPLHNLDYKLREELRIEMREIFQRRKSIVVYATTEPAEALALGGQTLVLHEGLLLQQGPTVSVYKNPASFEVAQIFSDPPMNRCEGRVSNGQVWLEGLSDPLRSDHLSGLGEGNYIFGIRPHHLITGQVAAGFTPVAGHVELSEISGSETFIHLNHAGGSWVVQQPGVYAGQLGDPLTVGLDPARLFAFDLHGCLVAAPVSQTVG